SRSAMAARYSGLRLAVGSTALGGGRPGLRIGLGLEQPHRARSAARAEGMRSRCIGELPVAGIRSAATQGECGGHARPPAAAKRGTGLGTPPYQSAPRTRPSLGTLASIQVRGLTPALTVRTLPSPMPTRRDPECMLDGRVGSQLTW